MLYHAGLWGDGDVVEAIELIEKRMNIRLRGEDAQSIWTVGDLWSCLLASNANLQDDKRHWNRFVVALTAYTGLNLREICPQTLLIEPKKPSTFKGIWNWFRGSGSMDA